MSRRKSRQFQKPNHSSATQSWNSPRVPAWLSQSKNLNDHRLASKSLLRYTREFSRQLPGNYADLTYLLSRCQPQPGFDAHKKLCFHQSRNTEGEWAEWRRWIHSWQAISRNPDAWNIITPSYQCRIPCNKRYPQFLSGFTDGKKQAKESLIAHLQYKQIKEHLLKLEQSRYFNRSSKFLLKYSWWCNSVVSLGHCSNAPSLECGEN